MIYLAQKFISFDIKNPNFFLQPLIFYSAKLRKIFHCVNPCRSNPGLYPPMVEHSIA